MKPKDVIKIYETNPDKPNKEGRKILVQDIVEVMSDEHVDWLLELLKNKYTPKEIIKLQEAIQNESTRMERTNTNPRWKTYRTNR